MDVLEAWPAANAHPGAARAFLVSPEDALAASRRARERGFEVVGTWHGHPTGGPALSSADAAGLLSASVGPGEGGVPRPRPHVFLVSGAGAGRAVTVLAYEAGCGRPAPVPLRVLLRSLCKCRRFGS